MCLCVALLQISENNTKKTKILINIKFFVALVALFYLFFLIFSKFYLFICLFVLLVRTPDVRALLRVDLVSGRGRRR